MAGRAHKKGFDLNINKLHKHDTAFLLYIQIVKWQVNFCCQNQCDVDYRSDKASKEIVPPLLEEKKDINIYKFK